jgi:serine protease Do
MKKLLLIGIVALMALSSCHKSLKDIVKDSEEAIFVIYTYDEFGTPNGLGSGFFIDEDGTGITNFHVLDGAVKAIIKTSDNKEYEIDSIIASDKNWDIVKFKIKNNENSFEYLKFATETPEKGSKVYNISSPLGLEKTVTEGIVSSLREDKRHGETVQITAPISSGSSGSPIIDEYGNVFAVATFIKRGGQNLNFGVLIDQEKIDNLDKAYLKKQKNKFNSHSNFIILNIPSGSGSDLTLNAIEFSKSATILYLTYINLKLASGDANIYIGIGKNDKDFMIEDTYRNKNYYVTSSTLGADKENATEVKLATTMKFKVYFPLIKDSLRQFSVYGSGKYNNRWQFKDIKLEEYRKSLNVNFESYKRDYALSNLRHGDWPESKAILLEMLEESPDDAIIINTLGIISYVTDNKSDAIDYFTESIDSNPNDPLGYINRYYVYRQQTKFSLALIDITKAINIAPDQAENYLLRAELYMKEEDWKNAKTDLDHLASFDTYKERALVYFSRAVVNLKLNNKNDACKDIYTSFQLTKNKELENNLQVLWNECGCR